MAPPETYVGRWQPKGIVVVRINNQIEIERAATKQTQTKSEVSLLPLRHGILVLLCRVQKASVSSQLGRLLC
jgi:hypothetical protein